MEIINKEVSIIIDTYNYGRFIEDAIESCLNQTFPQKDFEIIVVDDGSKDDTPERVKKYKDKIRYIYKENEGQASAFNLGFENSKGKYIFFLDADDYFLPHKIEKVVEEFEKYEDVIYVSNGAKLIDEEKREIHKEKPIEIHNVELTIKNINLIRKILSSPSSMAFKKNGLKKIMPIPIELKYAADIYLNGSIMWYGNLSRLPHNLTCIRSHKENVNVRYKKDINLISYHINAMKKAFCYIKENAKKSGRYDPFLFKNVNLPLNMEIMEKEFYLNLLLNKATRKELFKIEKEKFKFSSDWSIFYKIYRILRMPFVLSFSPKFYLKLKNLYEKKRIFEIRKIIFPD